VVGSISGNKSSNPLATPLNLEDEDHEEEKRRDASWKATKYCLIAFGATLGIVASYTVYELGTRELCRFTVQIMVWVLSLTTFQNYNISNSASTCLRLCWFTFINPLNAELNPICRLLALLGAHHFFHISRIRVKSLTLRLLMSHIYMEHPFLLFLDHT
jgi:hypothetical protein